MQFEESISFGQRQEIKESGSDLASFSFQQNVFFSTLNLKEMEDLSLKGEMLRWMNLFDKKS